MLQQEDVLFSRNGSNSHALSHNLKLNRRLNDKEDEELDQQGIENESVEEESRGKFEALVNRGSEVLFKLQSVFPFDLFPKTITIDPGKVTVKFQEFFSSGEIRSISIGSIGQIYVDTGPIFATLDIVDQVYVDESSRIKIAYLKKEEALRARRIIQGLIIARNEDIDIAKVHDGDLVRKLEQIGRMQ